MAGVDLSTRGYDGRVVAVLRGELDIAVAAGAAAVLGALMSRAGEIIIDLSGLEFIDCRGLAALAGIRAQARQAGGDVLLAAPQPQPRRILAATGLTHVFRVHASVREAAAAAGRAPGAGTAGRSGRDPPGRVLEFARPRGGRPGRGSNSPGSPRAGPPGSASGGPAVDL
jgi:anti-anti-sigma factor